MGVLDFLGSAIKPITDLIDNLTTTDEERGKLKTQNTNKTGKKIISKQSAVLQMLMAGIF